MNALRQLRSYLRSSLDWHFTPPLVQVQRPLQRLGSAYGGYFLDESVIRREAVVYSLGIGEDISFDLSLIETMGVEIQAFDPTPKVRKWIASQTLPKQFHFHEMGIAGFDGDAGFHLPPKEEWVSHSMIPARQYSSGSVRLPVTRLSTAMSLLRHDEVDVLKMDIEGAEYAVIEDIVGEQIPVRQLLVEFHHRLWSGGTEKTRRALSLLETRGMKVAHVCPRKETFTLVQAV